MRLEIKYGLIGAVAYILWEMGEYLLGIHDVHINMLPFTGLLSIFVPFSVLFFGIMAKRKSNPGFFLTLRQGIKAGLTISIIMALVSGAFFFIYTTTINPEFIATRTEMTRKSQYDSLLKKKQAESAEQARRMSIELIPEPSPSGAAMYYAMTRTSYGLILSAFISLIFRANPPKGFGEEEEDDDEEEEEKDYESAG